jgi:hypothetical protein
MAATAVVTETDLVAYYYNTGKIIYTYTYIYIYIYM